jgi:hypothetical protein
MEDFPVSVLVEHRVLDNRWQSEQWEAIAVGPGHRDDRRGCTLVFEQDRRSQWLWTGFRLELVRSEAENYFLNISAASPKVFVMWRLENDRAEPKIATVSYGEAARMMDSGEQVDGVAMPPEVFAWMAPFVAEHYKPEPRRKIRRNDPFAESREGTKQ